MKNKFFNEDLFLILEQTLSHLEIFCFEH